MKDSGFSVAFELSLSKAKTMFGSATSSISHLSVKNTVNSVRTCISELLGDDQIEYSEYYLVEGNSHLFTTMDQ